MPPNTTLLADSESTMVKEWGYASYDCKPGRAFPSSVADVLVDGNFAVNCGSGGAYEVMKIGIFSRHLPNYYKQFVLGVDQLANVRHYSLCRLTNKRRLQHEHI